MPQSRTGLQDFVMNKIKNGQNRITGFYDEQD